MNFSAGGPRVSPDSRASRYLDHEPRGAEGVPARGGLHGHAVRCAGAARLSQPAGRPDRVTDSGGAWRPLRDALVEDLATGQKIDLIELDAAFTAPRPSARTLHGDLAIGGLPVAERAPPTTRCTGRAHQCAQRGRPREGHAPHGPRRPAVRADARAPVRGVALQRTRLARGAALLRRKCCAPASRRSRAPREARRLVRKRHAPARIQDFVKERPGVFRRVRGGRSPVATAV